MAHEASPQEQAFLLQLASDPSDDTTRLVYADWLDEHGQPGGKHLRWEVELGRMNVKDPRYSEVETQCRALREDLSPEWLEQAGKRFDLWLIGYPRQTKLEIIKRIREVTGVRLIEAKEISEALPALVLEKVTRGQAEQGRECFSAPLEFAWESIEAEESRVQILPWKVKP